MRSWRANRLNEVHGDQVMVELNLPPLKAGPLQIEGHDGRIGQVINNLIDNARSFVPKGDGKIVVSAIKDERDIVIKVEDNGPGIEIFWRQFRAWTVHYSANR